MSTDLSVPPGAGPTEAPASHEERYRLMVEGSEQVFFYVHDTEHRFEYLSPSVRAVLGYPPEELLGRPYDVILSGEESDERVHALTRDALRSGEKGAPYVAHTRHRDGRVVVVELVESPVLRGGVVVGMQGFARDITERVRAEEALRESEEQLRQAQKMEAVGRLAGGIAHDFNNLLMAIRGNAELLLLDTPESDPSREGLLEIKRSSDRAASLTQQLLAFSRKQVLQPELVHPNALVDRIEPMLRRLIGENIEMETILAPRLGRVRADPGQLDQVLMNLVVNARDAMPEGGRLTIRTRLREVAGEVDRHPDAAERGVYVVLSVTDTGTGMDEEVRERVFEPFFTTKEPGKGTGLGLSTVYGIARQSGGYVRVESRVGEGSTFEVFLPRVRGTRPERTPGEEPASPALEGETVLVVEDERSVRTLARRILERYGFRVLEAENGEEALRLVESLAGPVHLVLTDVVMPGMSGRDSAERLARLHPELRVLYMSGYTDEVIAQHGVLDPGIQLLQKPFTPEALARKVREVLDAPAPPAR